MLLLNQLRKYLQEPRICFLATRDENLICEINRVLGIQLSSPNSMRIFVYEGTAEKTRKNLQANKVIALSITNGFTHESYQIKGKLVELRHVNAEERVLVSNYILDFEAMAVASGIPEGIALNQLPHSPALMIEFEVEQIFDQTPKIGTGKLLTAV